MKTIYRDSASEDLVVFDNMQDAHGSSIQTIAWKMKELIINSNDLVYDLKILLEKAQEIVGCCDELKAACNGKKVEIYTLSK